MFHPIPRLHPAKRGDPVAIEPCAVGQRPRPQALSGRAQLYFVTGLGDTCKIFAPVHNSPPFSTTIFAKVSATPTKPTIPVLLAELHEPPCSLHREAGLQDPRLVVDAAMDHAAVVVGLMPGPIRLLLEHHYGCTRVMVQKRPGSGKPNATAAYHHEAVHRRTFHSHHPC